MQFNETIQLSITTILIILRLHSVTWQSVCKMIIIIWNPLRSIQASYLSARLIPRLSRPLRLTVHSCSHRLKSQIPLSITRDRYLSRRIKPRSLLSPNSSRCCMLTIHIIRDLISSWMSQLKHWINSLCKRRNLQIAK
jgi:hypothetical protein